MSVHLLLPLPSGEGRGEGVLGAKCAAYGTLSSNTQRWRLRTGPLNPALSRREREKEVAP